LKITGKSGMICESSPVIHFIRIEISARSSKIDPESAFVALADEASSLGKAVFTSEESRLISLSLLKGHSSFL
jgi:hypothetical protein